MTEEKEIKPETTQETTKATTTPPKKTNKKKIWLYAMIIVLLVGVSIPVFQVVMKNASYNKAVAALEAKDYAIAINGFQELGDYKDSPEQLKEAKYQKATAALEEQDYTIAIVNFEELEDYKDSAAQLKEAKYQKYVKDVSSGIYDTSPGIGDYKDVLKYQAYAKGMKQWDFKSNTGNYGEAIKSFREASGVLDANEQTEKLINDCSKYNGIWKCRPLGRVDVYFYIKDGRVGWTSGNQPKNGESYVYDLVLIEIDDTLSNYYSSKGMSTSPGLKALGFQSGHDLEYLFIDIVDSTGMGILSTPANDFNYIDGIYKKISSTPPTEG